MDTRERRIFAKALADAVNSKMATSARSARQVKIVPPEVVNNVSPTPVSIYNDVTTPRVDVHVDMSPVAAALDRMSAAMEHQSEMLSQLLTIMADQKAPEVRVINQVEAPVIPPASVSVEAAKAPRRSKTKMTRDKNGEMDSTITEYEY